MGESTEDTFHGLATLANPFSEFPATGTFDFSVLEASYPNLSELFEEGAAEAIPILKDVPSICRSSLNGNLEVWNSGVEDMPSGVPCLVSHIDETIDPNSVHRTSIVQDEWQLQYDASGPTQGPHFLARDMNSDPAVHRFMLPEHDTFQLLSMDLDIGDVVPGLNEPLPASLTTPQAPDEIVRERMDLRPSLSTQTYIEPPLQGRSILRAWFESHNYPYPKAEELDELVRASGLSKKQVRTFFTNSRARSRKSADQFQRNELLSHALDELEGSGEASGSEIIGLQNSRVVSIQELQYYDDHLEDTVARDVDGRSSSQESSYRVEAGSKQQLSAAPSFENVTSSADSGIISDCLPLTRRRLFALSQKLKKEVSDLPNMERLSVQRFLAEQEYSADTTDIKKAIGETVDDEDKSNQSTSHSVVRGFTPSTLAGPCPDPPKKQKPTFMLGGSSDGSSIGVRSILSNASKRSDREALHGKTSKVTSFKHEVNIRRYSSEVAIESDSDSDLLDESAIDEDSESGWEDDDNDVYDDFRSVDSIADLRKKFQPVERKPDLRKPIDTTSNPVAVPGATSPRTTRRNMLATELTASLRKHLLWEKERNNSGHRNSQEPSSPPSKRRKSSSLASRNSSRASAVSASSYALSTTSSIPGRKGKRRWSQTLQQQDDKEDDTASVAQDGKKITYRCTFCWKSCKDRYSWTRHEDTHVEPDAWTCMPEGTPAVDVHCMFCDCLYGKPFECICHKTHHVIDCLKKPVEERTYSTKEGLKGHIRRVHKVEPGGLLLLHWHRTKDPYELRPDATWCGFCQESFETWKSRVDHVSAHFRDRSQSNHKRDWKCPPPRNTSYGKQDFSNNEMASGMTENVEDEPMPTRYQEQLVQDRESQAVRIRKEQRIKELEAELSALKSSVTTPSSGHHSHNTIDIANDFQCTNSWSLGSDDILDLSTAWEECLFSAI